MSNTPTNPSPNEIITLLDLQQESDDDSCMVCPNPCQDHESYPQYLKIDRTSPLDSTVKPYFRHVVISTGKSDWPERIDEESNSFAACLNNAIKDAGKKKDNKKNNDKNNSSSSRDKLENDESQEKPPKILITNSSRHNSDNVPFSDGNDILLFPDNILVRQVPSKYVSDFHQKFLSYKSNYKENDNEQQQQSSSSTFNFNVESIPYKAIILICSHRRRDKRCGTAGPILKSEFENVLRTRGLDTETRPNDGVGVFMTSHIGGHKFAGNLIVYRNGQGIWYGRVLPCHAKAIIQNTVIEGKVIKDLYRGSMNGSFGEGKGGKLEW
ncbi:1887_t:CDS:2 [Ambispora gerdemannii]|uniref:1887_t:CDS:1 n=1 Tax=Ambispora gerdemannii TaxID=144530 RepID=A0A9N8Z3C1_9GLOM|nr:1887_t:CDS:2 [Ambispora gerdemannii]